jgi:hypothetical protein
VDFDAHSNLALSPLSLYLIATALHSSHSTQKPILFFLSQRGTYLLASLCPLLTIQLTSGPYVIGERHNRANVSSAD